MRLKFFVLMFLFLLPVFCFADDFPEKSDATINDYSKVLGDTSKIEQRLIDFEKENSARMVVVVMPLKSDLNEYADKLFSMWNIGGRDDKGILFLMSSEKKEAILKLSYGINEKVKSEQLAELVSLGINPAISEGNYSGAVLLGIKDLEKIMKGEYNGVSAKSNNNWVFGVIFLFVVLFIIIASAYGRQERRRVIYNK